MEIIWIECLKWLPCGMAYDNECYTYCFSVINGGRNLSIHLYPDDWLIEVVLKIKEATEVHIRDGKIVAHNFFHVIVWRVIFT